MAKLTVYRLTFNRGVHLGTRGVNLEESSPYIPSDTLFSAVVDAHLRHGGEVDAFVQPFKKKQPPFLLTSVFPFAGSVRFFPMPVPLSRRFSSEVLRDRAKEVKRIRFVSDGILRRMLAGELMDDWLFPRDSEKPSRGVSLQGGLFWLTASEVKDLPIDFRMHPRTKRPIPLRAMKEHRVFATIMVPRVSIDRMNSASGIFHAGRVSFAPGCGLWFGVHHLYSGAHVDKGGPTFLEAFLSALAFLADEGLGGERSVGYGGFTWKEDPVPLELSEPSDGEMGYLLSRYHPRPEELPEALAEAAGYSLTSVGGWLHSCQAPAQRRRRLWLVTEGSVVRAVGSGIRGDLTDVRPLYKGDVTFPHPVWRYGLALCARFSEVKHA